MRILTVLLKEKAGYRVIRFTNAQVLNDLEMVMSKLIKALIK